MNKKQYNSIWAGSLALLLLAGSCSKSDETAAPEPSDGRIVVRALASDSGQAPSFDRFGLYIVQKAADKVVNTIVQTAVKRSGQKNRR